MPKMTIEDKREHFVRLARFGDLVQTSEAVVQHILSKHLEFVPRKKLYKFRTCSNQNFYVLSKNSIWMPPMSSFNDVFDGLINVDMKKEIKAATKWLENNLYQYCFELAKHDIIKNGGTFPFKYGDYLEFISVCTDGNGNIDPQAYAAHIYNNVSKRDLPEYEHVMTNLTKGCAYWEKNIDELARAILDSLWEEGLNFRDRLLVYCMTEHFDNPSLWENYADNYSGYCIAYSFADYHKKSFNDYKNLIYLMPITYRRHQPSFDVISCLDDSLRLRLLKEPGYEKNSHIYIDMNMQYYYKNKDYENEHEWRFAIDSSCGNLQYFPFISAIYAGRNIKPRNLQRLKNIAEKLNTPIYMQCISDDSNKFEYIKI